MKIIQDDLTSPSIIHFLEEHVEEMKAVTPVGSKHALDLKALKQKDVSFWSVVSKGEIIGCAALKELDPRHGELKSMRTSSKHRGQGIAATLLAFIIAEAKQRGYQRLSLETGSFHFFLPARKLYEKAGFQNCSPFADYKEDPNSCFMTIEL